MKKSFLLMLVALVFFTACKKDDAPSENKIIGKWMLDKAVSVGVSSGSPYNETDIFDAGDYLNFKADGTCTAVVEGSLSTTVWELLDNNRLLIVDNGVLDVSDTGYDIKELTNNSLQLYVKEAFGADYGEVTIYLKK